MLNKRVVYWATAHGRITAITMLILGLTGNVACGKSTVARQLAGYGAHLIDADAIVHQLYADTRFAAQVAGLFSPAVLQTDGTVDRCALGALVFDDAGAMARLEALVHPAVAARRDATLAELRQGGAEAVVLEAVKLVESGQAAACHTVWCVTCPAAMQLTRMMERRGLTKAQAMERLASQPSMEGKRALLTSIPLVVIANDGSLEDLERQVAVQWKMLCDTKATATTQQP